MCHGKIFMEIGVEHEVGEVGVEHEVGGGRTECRWGMLDTKEGRGQGRQSWRFSTFQVIPSACTRVSRYIRAWYRWIGSGLSAGSMLDLAAISGFTVGLTLTTKSGRSILSFQFWTVFIESLVVWRVNEDNKANGDNG
jgi:hypothetical protein